MAITKQEFYEGAAIHRLLREAGVQRAYYAHPFFHVDNCLILHIKYSTKTRSPWQFTFLREELDLLASHEPFKRVVIGLVCGADGIAALQHSDLKAVVGNVNVAAHVACRRSHREHYDVRGPAGMLPRKVPPSEWNRILSLDEGIAE